MGPDRHDVQLLWNTRDGQSLGQILEAGVESEICVANSFPLDIK